MPADRHIHLPYTDAFAAARSQFVGAHIGWLATQREDAAARVSKSGLPSRRVEDWKYTSLAPLADIDFAPAAAAAVPDMDVTGDRGLLPAKTPGSRLVFVNGHFRDDLSRTDDLPTDAVVLPISQALESHGEILRAHLGDPSGPLTDLNAAFMGDGALIHVPAGVALDAPVHLVFAGAAGDSPLAFHPRVLVIAGAGAEAVLVESHVGDGPYWTNPVVDIALGPDARLDHYKLQQDGTDATHTAVTRAQLETGARYENFALSMGAALARNEITVRLDGENAEARLLGGYLGGGTQHSDTTTLIEHAKPGGRSRELYRGVLDGKARGVFQGKILVARDAQKTDAHMLNKTLLLSDTAEIDAKPELEIYADDVKCGHGATAGEIEEDALFYLRARGIGETQARGMLISAFMYEIVEEVGFAPVRERLSTLVGGWLAAHGEEGQS